MDSKKPKSLFTDGEGPIVYNDLAREISARLQGGQQFFDTLSLWVTYLTELYPDQFQPGETLAFLVPHLLANGIKDDDLRQEASRNTKLTPGVREYLGYLRSAGREVRIISTAYQHLWEIAGPMLDIPPEHISSTRLSLDQLEGVWPKDLSSEVKAVEETIQANTGDIMDAHNAYRSGQESLTQIFAERPSMVKVEDIFRDLYMRTLPLYGFNPSEITRVIGGDRKAEAIRKFSEELGIKPSDCIYVGDSITDDRAHAFIAREGGLAVSFNGDYFAIRNATIAVAARDARALVPLIDAFDMGHEGVRRFVERQQVSYGGERSYGPEPSIPDYIIIDPTNIEMAVRFSGIKRRDVRGESLPLL